MFLFSNILVRSIFNGYESTQVILFTAVNEHFGELFFFSCSFFHLVINMMEIRRLILFISYWFWTKWAISPCNSTPSTCSNNICKSRDVVTDVKARYRYMTFVREAFNRKRGNEVSIESSLGRLTELFALLKIIVTENIISLLTSLGIPLCRKLDWGVRSN